PRRRDRRERRKYEACSSRSSSASLPPRRLHVPPVLVQDDRRDLAGRIALERQGGHDDVVVEAVLSDAEHGKRRLPREGHQKRLGYRAHRDRGTELVGTEVILPNVLRERGGVGELDVRDWISATRGRNVAAVLMQRHAGDLAGRIAMEAELGDHDFVEELVLRGGEDREKRLAGEARDQAVAPA